ncbi:MAG TPA: cytochrome b N-terminal domain-containing protein [Thermoanaerobaculia bacterium]|nr:cytochrome b N-terminal domain-containing protein [Thermoanaerobaculia bacterium]
MSRGPGFDERTGIVSAWRRFAEKPTPSRGGWWFTLGSIALALLVLQLATGILLASAYAPTPDHARASVAWIERQVPAGSFVRGLHAWGASAVVVFVLLHLARVFWHGAYRPPRQENWWVGLLLLATVFAFAFTGYLLPWDQKGYWATVVGIRIAAQPPIVGPVAQRVLTGGAGVGAGTLSRFAAIHVIVLPLAAAGLAAAHLLFLRRQGHAGVPGDASPREPFFPKQMARDAAAVLAVCAVVAALARFLPASLEATADPTDTAYVPRPDWYFLAPYQLLHYFHGKAAILGTFGIPAAIGIFLVAMPLLDRSATRHPKNRRPWIAAGTGLAAAAIVLTGIAVVDAPAGRLPATEPPPPPLAFVSADLKNYDLSMVAPSIARGGKLIATKKCLECHWINGDGNPKGIDLKHVGERRTRAWLLAHFRDPQELSPHSKMPPYDDLPARDLNDITDYLLALP